MQWVTDFEGNWKIGRMSQFSISGL